MGLHLLNGEKNEHVTVHQVRGFVSEDVLGALNEAYALSSGTKCTQFMYSANYNPPPGAYVSIETFEDAIDRTEKKLGLEGQPRIIVFHEKEGRRHAHCVWSRIISEEMKAVNISHPKLKLKTLSKELFLENGWEMPKGLIDHSQKNPLNFTRAEWEQAQRTGQNPKTIKSALQDSWAVSDSRKAFEHAMRERGYYLAKGDKRGFVTIDVYGEVYSLTRQIKINKSDLEKRLGKPEDLRSVEETKKLISGQLTRQFQGYSNELTLKHKQEKDKLLAQKKEIVQYQRQTRQKLKSDQSKRWQKEELKRSARLRKGYKGLWDRLTGTYQKTRSKNEKEAARAYQRDRKEREALIAKQLATRQKLQTEIHKVRNQQILERASLLKGMSKHYEKIDRQKEIREMYEREKHLIRRHKKDQEPEFNPEI